MPGIRGFSLGLSSTGSCIGEEVAVGQGMLVGEGILPAEKELIMVRG